MTIIPFQAICLVPGPFDIGPTGIFSHVDTLYINAPRLHEIGLPGSTFGQYLDCGLEIAECGFEKAWSIGKKLKHAPALHFWWGGPLCPPGGVVAVSGEWPANFS